ncbi:aspartate dehydrogenase [Paraburkholderia caballeronis]|nr:aspartate dehydrogenase [Paraburkholderia caballeronis]
MTDPANESGRNMRRSAPLRVTLIGFGAIGSTVFDAFASDPADPAIAIDQIVVSPRSVMDVARKVGPAIAVASRIGDLPRVPQLAVECAGHCAIGEHVIPLLRSGVECAIVSIGAFADDALRDACDAAAAHGNVRASLLSGAVGGLDALAAAAAGGLDDVLYVGRKPVDAWRGTPAEAAGMLDGIRDATTIFDGTARDTARLYPKNANVAAAVALAGVGFERTRVRLLADPAATRNTHTVRARGAFGALCVEIAASPFAQNPKTSALTAFSVIRFLRERASGRMVLAATVS